LWLDAQQDSERRKSDVVFSREGEAAFQQENRVEDFDLTLVRQWVEQAVSRIQRLQSECGPPG